MNEQYQIDALLDAVKELRFALTDSLITLQRVYQYAVMPRQDVNKVKESLTLAEDALAKTDNI